MFQTEYRDFMFLCGCETVSARGGGEKERDRGRDVKSTTAQNVVRNQALLLFCETMFRTEVLFASLNQIL